MEHPDQNGRNDQSGKMESGDISHSETHHDAITGDLRQPIDVNIDGGKVSFNLYGNLTIAEVIEIYEGNAPVKVVSATLNGDIVTLTYEPIPHDDVFDDPDPEEWDGYYCSGCNCPHHSCACEL